MRITVTGPESSGTSLVARILADAGAEVFHRSATFSDRWPSLTKLADSCDAMIVVFRDPISTLESQRAQGLSHGDASIKLVMGYYEIADAIKLVSVPTWCVTYEQLVLDPNSIRPLLRRLGLDADVDIEDITNENVKYSREHE